MQNSDFGGKAICAAAWAISRTNGNKNGKLKVPIIGYVTLSKSLLLLITIKQVKVWLLLRRVDFLFLHSFEMYAS